MKRFLPLLLWAVSLGSTTRVDFVSQAKNGPAVLATLNEVHSNPVLCTSKNLTTAYTCSLIFPTGGSGLVAYTTGIVLLLVVDTSCTTSCTVDVDTLGVVSVKKSDGATDPDGTLTAGVPRWIYYNGSVFILI